MIDYEKLVTTLKRHEGTVRDDNGNHKLYQCPAGKWTIGWGYNIQDNGLDDDVAEHLLRDMIRESNHKLSTFNWFLRLSERKQEALVNMHYQLGHSRFLLFRKMIAAFHKGDHKLAAAEMLDSKWARTDSPARAKELADVIEADDVEWEHSINGDLITIRKSRKALSVLILNNNSTLTDEDIATTLTNRLILDDE